MIEQWKPVVGYEGIYEVSDQGSVRSLDRIDSRGHKRKGRMLKPRQNRYGHLGVSFSKDGKVRHFEIHRLVLLAFVGPQPEGMQCCHYDDVPTNNHIGNLRWDTPSANMQDKLRNGNYRNQNMGKTHCPQGHPYVDGNLVLSQLKRGNRVCIACSRARNSLNPYGGYSEQVYQVVSDEKYRDLIAA